MFDEDVFAEAEDIPQPRVRVDSDSSVKREAREDYYHHSTFFWSQFYWIRLF
jgi:hypothetical protein